jgi:O-antigen/teichoic acid export membrane protein
MSFLELVTDLSMGTQLVQASDGDDSGLQGTIHTATVSRGVLMSAALFLLASPLAWLFNVGSALWAFRCLALVPLVRSFAHSDINRLQRHLNFLPLVATEVGSQAIALVAAWPLTAYFEDYSAVLWLLIIQGVSYAAATHLLSQRRYRFSWEPSCVRRVIGFGWPLLINGLIMFAVYEGDRVVIGAADRIFGGMRYTLADLGVYFLSFALASAVIVIPAKIGGAVFLPILSRVQNDQSEFQAKYQLVVQLFAPAGAILALPLILMGGWLAVRIFGTKYAAISPIVVWIASAQAVRLMRGAVVLAGLSRGDTLTSMMGSLVRLLGVLGVLGAAAAGTSLTWVAAAGFAGEVLALGFVIPLLRRWHDVPIRLSLEPILISMSAMALGGIVGSFVRDRPLLAALTVVTIAVLMLGMMFVRLAPFRTECERAWEEVRCRILGQVPAH